MFSTAMKLGNKICPQARVSETMNLSFAQRWVALPDTFQQTFFSIGCDTPAANKKLSAFWLASYRNTKHKK